MTPEQLEIAEAFKQVSFRANSPEKKFVDAFLATVKKSPGFELTDKQDAYIRDLCFRYRREMPIGLVLQQVQHGHSTFMWMAPDLARSGLIKNEPWVPDNAAKAVALFQQKTLHTCAALVAALHPNAFGYIALAPVLVLAISEGSSMSKNSERKKVARDWSNRFEVLGIEFKERHVRKLMESVGLSYSLRKLHASVLESSHWATVQALCTINKESTLSQIIPAREDQKQWLESIGRWSAHMGRRFQNPGLHFEWACRQFNPDNMRRTNQDVQDVRNNASNIADFAGTHPNRFNLKWTIDSAMRETRRWHDEIARMTHEQKYFQDNARGWDDPIDYKPFPSQMRIGDCVFIALQSGKQLFEEGRDMHHCVGSYSRDVISGNSRIYSMVTRDRDGIKRIATVEFSAHKGPLWNQPDPGPNGMTAIEAIEFDGQKYRHTWHVVQCKGPYNAMVSKEHYQLVEDFCNKLNYMAAAWDHSRRVQESYMARLEQVKWAAPTMMMTLDEARAIGIAEAVDQMLIQQTLPAIDRLRGAA